MTDLASPSPWLVATLNTATFLTGCLLLASFARDANAVDLAYLFSALMFPAAAVFWWAFGWVHSYHSGKATAKAATLQGWCWGGFLAVSGLMILLTFGSNLTAQSLTSTATLLEIAPTVLRAICYSCFAGMVTALLLHWENLVFVRLKAVLWPAKRLPSEPR
jgi:hypothetical protein